MKEMRDIISKEALIPSIKFLVSKKTKNKMWQNLIPPFIPLGEKRQLELTSLYTKFYT